MPPEKNLKVILSKLKYPDDALVMKQITDQLIQVKTRMGLIKRKVVVMSGKGGVGKSLVTVNLALALARLGHKVGILDVDLNGPCVPKMLGLKGATMSITPEGAIPPTGPFGIKVASMEFFLKEGSPLRWKGPMDLSPVWLGMLEMSVLREFLADILWGPLDYLLADLPPGAAADKPPVIVGFLPELDGAVIVTIPSEISTEVVRKSVLYARDLGIPVLGLVENMSGYRCPDCNAISPLFEGDAKPLCDELSLPLLGRIPFDRALGQSADQGKPLLSESEPSVKIFMELARQVQNKTDSTPYHIKEMAS